MARIAAFLRKEDQSGEKVKKNATDRMVNSRVCLDRSHRCPDGELSGGEDWSGVPNFHLSEQTAQIPVERGR